MFNKNGKIRQIEWTAEELAALQEADIMVKKGGYNLEDILAFLNTKLRPDKQRKINIPKEVKNHGNA